MKRWRLCEIAAGNSILFTSEQLRRIRIGRKSPKSPRRSARGGRLQRKSFILKLALFSKTRDSAWPHLPGGSTSAATEYRSRRSLAGALSRTSEQAAEIGRQ